MAFHHGTWRTIDNVGFHAVDKVKLHNLEAPHGSADIELDQQLALWIVHNDVVRTLLPQPHVKHRLDVGLLWQEPNCQTDYLLNRSINFDSHLGTAHARFGLRGLRCLKPRPVPIGALMAA